MSAHMIESTSSAPTLQERAAQRAREDSLEDEKRAAEQATRARESAITILVIQIEKYLGVAVDPNAVRYDAEAKPPARIEIDGLTFGMFRYPSYSDCEHLSVAMPCARGCGHPVWVEIIDYRLASLHRAITEPQTHLHDCLVQYDQDGDPITDRNGYPLPPAQPPTPTPQQQARESIAAIDAAAGLLAAAVERVTRLEDERARQKAAAIKRLMATTNELTQKPHSASSAEAVVETDNAYALYRELQREAEVERWRALAAYEAAKLSARLDVALVESGAGRER